MNTHKTTALACGVIAGPLFAIAGLAQAFTRDGFDLTHHQLSLLTNGSLGWIQVLNFISAGALFLAGAAGMRRTLASGHASRWGPRLVATFGVGMIGAGVFRPDPAFGFPTGTPDAKPDSVSWHGAMHYMLASVGFLALIIAAVLFARRFAATHDRGWAAVSALVGVALLVGVAAVSSGSSTAAGNVIFVTAALGAFLWVSAVAAHLLVDSRRATARVSPARDRATASAFYQPHPRSSTRGESR